MTRLNDYRSALLAGSPAVSADELDSRLEQCGSDFVSFVIDHGLGPLWHLRTGRSEFYQSRLAAEALYAAQESAIREIGPVLAGAGIDFAVFKGAASRLVLYDNPAIRACHDIDVLVRPTQRVQAVAALVEAGFKPFPEPLNIGHEVTLSKGAIDLDIHWGLLREGRLRHDPVEEILDRRRQMKGVWMLDADDEFFVLLVHPAFSKHLAAWEMGLHRVLDILSWLGAQAFDWSRVYERLDESGVRTAAWATLRWVDLLAAPHSPAEMHEMLSDLRPGRLRAAWIDRLLQNNMPERSSSAPIARLLGLSLFLHDTPKDALRAVAGRQRARRRQAQDLAEFRGLLGQ